MSEPHEGKATTTGKSSQGNTKPEGAAKVKLPLVAALAAIVSFIAVLAILTVTARPAETQANKEITLHVVADGLDDAGSRVPLKVEGADAGGNAYDEVVYAAPSDDTSLPQGTYDVSVAGSPIASDGTIYSWDDSKVSVSTDGDQSDAGEAQLSLTPVAATDVAQDQIDAAVDWAQKDEGLSVNVDDLKEAAQSRMAEGSEQAAIDQYRQTLADIPSQGAFTVPGTPTGEYWYALVKMSQDDDPTMLVAQSTTSGQQNVRLYHYNPQTRSVDATTQVEDASGSTSDGILQIGAGRAGGFRGGLTMEKDGNGLCWKVFSSGTGDGTAFRCTQDGSTLKVEEQGEISLRGGDNSDYVGETIQWLGIADTRALDSWPEAVQSTGENGFPADDDTTTSATGSAAQGTTATSGQDAQSVDQAGSGSGSSYENAYFSVQVPDNWGTWTAGSGEDGTWRVVQTSALDGAVATYNCSFMPVIPAGMDPEAWHDAGGSGGGAIISVIDPSSGSSSPGGQTIGRTSSGLEIVVVTEAGEGFTNKCTITPK